MEQKRMPRLWLSILIVSVMATSTACSSSNTKDPKGTGDSTPTKGAPVKVVGLNCNATFDRKTPEEKHVHDILQEKTGADVNIVFSEAGQCVTKRNLMLSSGEQLEFAEMSITDAIQAYNDGVILSLNDLLDKYGPNLKKNVVPAAFEKVTYKNQILGIPIETPVITPNALQIRTDWLAKLNLSMPKTVDDYEKIMEAFKTGDPDGNGKADTYALSTGSGGRIDMLEYVFAPFFQPAATAWWKDSDGKIKPPELHPSYKDMMAKFVEWKKRGYIWPDMVLSTAPKQQELIAQNKAGTVAASFSGTIINAVEVLRKTVPDAQYVPVALEGKGINKLPAAPAATSAWVIFKKNASPEAVMKYFDYQATPEGSDLVYFGVEGENFTRGTNKLVEFVADDKTDLSKAKYYAKYKTVFINWPGSPVWPANTWVHQEYNLKRDQVHKLPRFDPIDAKVLYDTSKWKSFSKLTDLNTYWSEQKIKVFNGEIPVENWDSIVKKWLEIGGQQMIDDKNEQFAAAAK
ncbi:hypothetical protein [Paenibacillus sp. HJGM_3]|uniref:hypothetical protein n=1 Tax=Paenibacillus sp. HJGM_3 TaxID=3379816 RepID=UPI00386F14D2